MIGNDIIDLSEANQKSRWQKRGFPERIFTKKEQSFLSCSSDPELMIWLLWSLKESVFKASAQIRMSKYFYPLKYEFIPESFSFRKKIISGNEFNSVIKYADILFNAESIITVRYISSYVNNKDVRGEVLKGVLKLSGRTYEIQHREVYSSFIRNYSRISGIKQKFLNVKKDIYGVPHLYENDRLTDCRISFSHHGEYGAYFCYM